MKEMIETLYTVLKIAIGVTVLGLIVEFMLVPEAMGNRLQMLDQTRWRAYECYDYDYEGISL